MSRFLLSVAILSTLLVVVYSQGEGLTVITKDIDQETKKSGEQGRLNCTVANPYNFDVQWFRVRPNGRTQHLTTGRSVIFNPDIGNGKLKYDIELHQLISAGVITTTKTTQMYTLIVNSLQIDDAGVYRCQIQIPEDNNPPYKEGLLVVQIPPRIEEARTTKGPVYIKSGESITLKCASEGIPRPTLTWTRTNGKPLPGGRFKVYGGDLTIHGITWRDRGAYRCNANNNVPKPAYVDIQVVVHYRPQARTFRDYVGQMPDRNYKAEMTCIVSGYPIPDIKWSKVVGSSRERIIDDSKHKIYESYSKGMMGLKEGDRWSTMIIINVQSNDFANFSCAGTNSLGTNEAFIRLFYTPTCQGSNCPQESLGGASNIAVTSLTIILPLLIARLLYDQ